jgi:hypothetical protein
MAGIEAPLSASILPRAALRQPVPYAPCYS